jgi:hypothetical protein
MMKNIFSIASFFLLPAMGFSQTKADYEHAVSKLAKFYNNDQPDSVYKLLSDKWGSDKKNLFSPDNAKALLKRYGKIKSYKYIGKDPEYYDDQLTQMVFFKVVYTMAVDGRREHAMSISLDEQNKIYGFNFITSSPHIDSFVLRK